MREELRREPKTLFLCNTYSVGKENAADAVVDASGRDAVRAAQTSRSFTVVRPLRSLLCAMLLIRK